MFAFAKDAQLTDVDNQLCVVCIAFLLPRREREREREQIAVTHSGLCVDDEVVAVAAAAPGSRPCGWCYTCSTIPYQKLRQQSPSLMHAVQDYQK